MTNLISRSAAIKALNQHSYENSSDYDTTVEFLNELPSIDVAPVVHAYWKYNTFMWENDWHCSHCDGWVNKPTKYCPSCGAMMDKKGK